MKLTFVITFTIALCLYTRVVQLEHQSEYLRSELKIAQTTQYEYLDLTHRYNKITGEAEHRISQFTGELETRNNLGKWVKY